MTPAAYRMKPIVIQAMQVTDENTKVVCDWVYGDSRGMTTVSYHAEGTVIIQTLEGTMRANVGDWVIRGVQGEFYPCKDSIFRETYEELMFS
jgi:hypothetical protein